MSAPLHLVLHDSPILLRRNRSIRHSRSEPAVTIAVVALSLRRSSTLRRVISGSSISLQRKRETANRNQGYRFQPWHSLSGRTRPGPGPEEGLSCGPVVLRRALSSHETEAGLWPEAGPSRLRTAWFARHPPACKARVRCGGRARRECGSGARPFRSL